MKRILNIIFLAVAMIAASPSIKAQPHLGDSAFAALITCGPGDEFYTTFGHSAIRICDSVQNIDVVYNYGMFSFDIEHFYWTFAKGDLNYWVSRGSFNGFLFEYAYYGRAVWQQKLNITNQELNNLFVALEWNILPENKYYRYDFFMDNCATRSRDMIANCLSHRTIYTEQRTKQDPTFRNEVYRCTEGTLLWWRFGIDMLLGIRCDHHASNAEQMFSPVNMMAQFDTLTFSDSHQPVVQPAEVILAETRTPLHRSISPTLTFWVFCVLTICLTILSWAKHWHLRWFDAILFFLIGLLSIVILFLWIFSTHYCTKFNLNILWCSPLFLYFTFRLRHLNRWTVMFQMALILVLMVAFWWMPQQFNAAFFPIMLAIFVRLLDKLKAQQ